MPRFLGPRLLWIFLAVSVGFPLETVTYVNDAAALPVGARSAGMAGVSLGMVGDPSHIALSPAGLTDVVHPEFVFHQASLYQGLSLAQTEIFLAAPLSFGTVGFSLSRVGVDGILATDRGQVPDFANPATFSATDWMGSLAFARTWFGRRLRGGAALRILGRDIGGYYGAGSQLDASVVWVQNGFRAGLRLDRGLGGVARWESGWAEYSPPDVVLGLGYERRVPYFYGNGSLAWETPGLFQKQAASSFSVGDPRLWVDPWLFVRSSRLAAEFRFNMGLVLRAGLEIQAITRALVFMQGTDSLAQFGESRGMVSAGAGYLWADRVRVDYALVAHPDLGISQRFSVGLVFGVAEAKAAKPKVQAALPPIADESQSPPESGTPQPSPVDSGAEKPPSAPAAPPPPRAPAPPVAHDEWDAPEQPAP